MTFYREITPINEPFDGGLDDNGRSMVIFNMRAIKEPSVTLIEELVKLLVTAGVGTWNTNIFATAKAQIPAEGGPFLSIRETGGAEPLRIQNQNGPAYLRPSVQIVVRSPEYDEAYAMAKAAYAALAPVRNANVVP